MLSYNTIEYLNTVNPEGINLARRGCPGISSGLPAGGTKQVQLIRAVILCRDYRAFQEALLNRRSSDSGIQSWRRSITFAGGAAARHPGPMVARRDRECFRPVSYGGVDTTKAICNFIDAIRLGFGLDLGRAAVHTISYSPQFGLHATRFAY